MKIVSFNANGLRARIHQIKAIIEKHQPDVIGIQETKVSNDQFPLQDIKKLGYDVSFHGQKGHYGVALIYRVPLLECYKGFPHDDKDSQKRLITGDFQYKNKKITIFNGYFPQGESRSHDKKFPCKEKFYLDLQAHLEANYSPQDQILVIGDMNVAPLDKDIGIGEENRKRWLRTGKCCFLPEERSWLQRLENFGLIDTFENDHKEQSDRYTWFDYRSRGFEMSPKRGLRIDLILASKPLMKLCIQTGIDHQLRSMEKPSDHCPIWISLYD